MLRLAANFGIIGSLDSGAPLFPLGPPNTSLSGHKERTMPSDVVASRRSMSTAAGGAAFELTTPLPASLLYRRCDPAELPFEVCSELEQAPGLIGQTRAEEAL